MPIAPTLIDTGPIVAIINADDPYHTQCTEAIKRLPVPLHTCWPVITEAAYLLRKHPQGIAKLFEMLRTQVSSLAHLSQSDLSPIESILTKYADQKFQLADAALMYLSERQGISRVFTIDYKDFSLFRTAQGKSLTLLPE